MSVKMINIAIPDDEKLPDIIHTFSPKENFMMLKIGSICLNEGRNYVANLSQEEIYKKIKDESKSEIDKIEMNLMVQREMSKQMEAKLSKIYEGMYEGQIEQVNKQNERLENMIVSLKEKFPLNQPSPTVSLYQTRRGVNLKSVAVNPPVFNSAAVNPAVIKSANVNADFNSVAVNADFNSANE
jgi:hypothetical protein